MAAAPALDPARLRLRPFDPATAPPRLGLGASLRRQGPRLEIRWVLSGDLRQLRLPEAVEEPQRLDALWTSTCLECFLARPAQESYWELNLSPAGHWNLYRLEGYRQGLRPEPAIQRLSSQRLLGGGSDRQDSERRDTRRRATNCRDSTSNTESEAERGRQPPLPQASVNAPELAWEHCLAPAMELTLDLCVELDLEALLGAEASSDALELGVTAVLERQNGQLSYWALHHPAAEADFHHREGFCLRMPGSSAQSH